MQHLIFEVTKKLLFRLLHCGRADYIKEKYIETNTIEENFTC